MDMSLKQRTEGMVLLELKGTLPFVRYDGLYGEWGPDDEAVNKILALPGVVDIELSKPDPEYYEYPLACFPVGLWYDPSDPQTRGITEEAVINLLLNGWEDSAAPYLDPWDDMGSITPKYLVVVENYESGSEIARHWATSKSGLFNVVTSQEDPFTIIVLATGEEIGHEDALEWIEALADG